MKNQLTTSKNTALILGKTKSLMGITVKILEGKGSDLAKVPPSQELAMHKDIVMINGLMWEKEIREMTWYDAMEYAKNLRLGGYDDWRLPTIEELESIVTLCGGELINKSDDQWDEKADKNEEDSIYQEAYKKLGFSSNYYWSSTISASNYDYEDYAYVVDFRIGFVDEGPRDFDGLCVHCVRAGQ